MTTPRRATLCLIVAVLPLLASTASPGPLSKPCVAAGARWVVHLDVERFALSQTCQELTRHATREQAFQSLIGRYRDLLGSDPLHTLFDVTLYGESPDGARPVAILRGTFSETALAQRLSRYPRYGTNTVMGFALHRWEDKAAGTGFHACFPAPRLLALGLDEPSVVAAAQVISGARPSLKAGRTTHLSLPAETSHVFFTAVARNIAGAATRSFPALMLRHAEAATVQIGERKGMIEANLSVAAASPEAVFQIQETLNGLLVSASLAPDDSGLAQLVGMSAVERRGQTLALRLQCPANKAASALANAILSR
jgi:hypothetical protein